MPLFLIAGLTGIFSGALGFILGQGVSGLGDILKYGVIGFAGYLGLKKIGVIR